ncbi:MAG: LodA/GoxA family CTQ-dependent oxidase [Flavobacteriaceae bacterium]
MSVLDSITHIKVFPGIGTARVGNSPEYFIGPEFPGDVPNLDKNYKDKNGLLKPQAARFRVYGYDAKGDVVSEITHDPANGVTLEWDVHVRNLKAANYAFQGKFGFNPDQYRNPGVPLCKANKDPNCRTGLIIDPGKKKIIGTNQSLPNGNSVALDGGKIFSGIGEAEIPTSMYIKGTPGMTKATYNEKEVSLGRLETDIGGRLIFVGGKGEAGCLIEPPIILQKGAGYLAVQLGKEQTEVSSTGSLPDTFYTNSEEVSLPKDFFGLKFLLSSKNDATGDVFVDDQCIIKVNDKQIYSHDFSNGNSGKITPKIPINITDEIAPYLGQNVKITIEYVDLYGGKKGGSAFYLCYTNNNPTSNGNSYFNNPGWYDDTCGGSVNATVKIVGTNNTVTTLVTADDVDKRGWVAVSPPKYTPTMNNVVSLLDLQLTMFPEADPVSGTVNFALIGNDGTPNFSEGSIPDFKPLSGLSSGYGSPSMASFNGNDYMVYTNILGELFIAESTDKGITWKNNKVNALTTNKDNFDVRVSYSPSLCVFNGALTLAVVMKEGILLDEKGCLYVGTSTDGSTFTFEEVKPQKGTSAAACSSPNISPYNGQLYISYAGADNCIVIAHKYLVPNSSTYLYTFDSLKETVYDGTSPRIGEFFGQLYCAYTGTDCNAYIGYYKNYSPAPAEPAVVSFGFNGVQGAPKSKLSPTIAASHGKLFYAIVDTSDCLNLARVAPVPVLNKANFEKQDNVKTKDSIAIANFSNIEFYRDVYPTLKTVTDYAWVNEPAFHGHAPGKPGDFLRENSLPYYSNPDDNNNVYRKAIFKFLREPEQLTPLVPPPPYRIPNPTDKTVDGVKRSIPDGGIQSGTLMPHLFGEGGSPLENGFNGTNFPNQWLSLTPHQLWKFQEWVNGNFTAGTKPVTPHVQKSFNNIPLEDQPAALNFSALEPTVGGGFHPGIELTYYMKEPGFFAEAFRFADAITNTSITDDQKGGIKLTAPLITPGSVAGYMSIPWQGDFWSCNISWWAAMRPDIVIPPQEDVPPPFIPWYRGKGVGIPANADNIPNYEGGYEHMVRYWSDFGFVVPTGQTDQGMFIMEESERNPCLDNVESPCAAKNQPENALIGAAISATSSSKPSNIPFYTNTIDLLIPASGDIYLAGSSDGTKGIFVDDEVVIKMTYQSGKDVTVDGITTTKLSPPITSTIYSHDFSNGNSGAITKLPPVNLTDAIRNTKGYRKGTIVSLTVEYIDTNGGNRSSSEFWLIYPTS